MKLRTVVFLLAVLCGAPAHAAKFYKINGSVVTGELRAVDEKGVMTVQPERGGPVQLASDELMRVEFVEDGEPDELLDGVVLYLPGGDRLPGTLAGSSQSAVDLRSAALGTIRLPIDRLLALEFRRAGEQPKNAETLRRQMLHNTSRSDVTFSANGDQLPGIVVRFTGKKVTLKTAALGEMSLDCSRLFGISFAARKRPPPPPSLLVVVRCSDGTVATGRLRASRGGGVKVALLAGPVVEIGAEHLLEFGFRQGKLVYLSDLKPEKVEYKPYFGGDPTWPYQRDRNYDHGPIRLRGRTYRKGLGTFSGMRLTYRLAGQFKKFGALVGIDDADVHHQGDVTVRVLADGREVFRKAGITRRSGPVQIDLSVQGVRTLELAVDYGGNMHFGDLADWANARLIR